MPENETPNTSHDWKWACVPSTYGNGTFKVNNTKDTEGHYFIYPFVFDYLTEDVTLRINGYKNQHGKIVVFADANEIVRNLSMDPYNTYPKDAITTSTGDSIVVLSPQTSGRMYTERNDPFYWRMTVSLINTVKYELSKFTFLGNADDARFKKYMSNPNAYWTLKSGEQPANYKIETTTSSTEALVVSSDDNSSYKLNFSLSEPEPPVYYAAVCAKQKFKEIDVKIYIGIASKDISQLQVSTNSMGSGVYFGL